ncbi:hypothetical protein [Polaribacter sp. MED152]|uniref:hypothetical protein n=1 Tax=Polaribacter sp. MED152 TaxID=313598 RepID=UPI000068CAAB|nr:hypothetical protein [Polaribacter sp. MED152]EAQ42176.1 hypothetical protein MED152_05640 [Polaribacter sp. MED152]
MKLVIIKDKFLWNNMEFSLDDLHTHEFHEFSNEISHKYYNNSFFVNELFINFIQNFLAIEFFIIENNILSIKLTKSSPNLYYLIKEVAKKHNLNFNGSRNIHKLINLGCFYYYIFSSSVYLIYLMLKISFEESNEMTGAIAITRRNSCLNRMTKLNINTIVEDPYDINSIYKYIPTLTRVKLVLISIKESFFQLKEMKILITRYMGKESKYLINSFYGKRIVHTMLYKNVLNLFFKLNNYSKFYTGNNLDRFAFIEEKIAKEYNLDLICIPHGLEYGFKFPKCFTGDTFFATSKIARDYLNKLYNTTKFEFDFPLLKTIFKLETKKSDNARIVFFSEPREKWVNHQIIKDLIPLLNKDNLKLHIKLHPYDDIKDYNYEGVNIIKDFNEAICGNICFARKSTILIEALYNNSSASSILLNTKDKTLFFSFPSLTTRKLNRAFTIDQLYNWIKIEYKKNNYE